MQIAKCTTFLSALFLLSTACMVSTGIAEGPTAGTASTEMAQGLTAVMEATDTSEVATASTEEASTESYVPQGPGAGTELFPPNPQPGGCYARVLVPANYKTKTVSLLKQEASERIEIIPAKFKPAEETLVVKEASKRLEIIPATYEWVEEQVLVKPAHQRVEVVPAEYETVSEKVIDKPAHVAWEKGRGLIEKVDFATGEILCLKDVPATYKTVVKRIQKSPATPITIDIPAEYTTVKKRIMKTPPATKTITIPEETRTVKVMMLGAPAKVQRVPVPEERQSITKKVKVSEEKMGWRPVLCETNTTPHLVKQVQRSLKEKGHSPGPVDGTLGAATMKAVVAFQKAQGLPRGGLTMETFSTLDIDLPWISEGKAIVTGGGAQE